jgi:hypothetical protein
VGQLHVDVGVKRSLGSTAAFIFRAMAPGAVGAKHWIKSVFERFQRALFVKTHLVRKYSGFDVRSTASVRKLSKHRSRRSCDRGL